MGARERASPFRKRARVLPEACDELLQPVEEHHHGFGEVECFLILVEAEAPDEIAVPLPVGHEQFLHALRKLLLAGVKGDLRRVKVEEVLEDAVGNLAADLLDRGFGRQLKDILVVVFPRTLLVGVDAARTLQPLFLHGTAPVHDSYKCFGSGDFTIASSRW